MKTKISRSILCVLALPALAACGATTVSPPRGTASQEYNAIVAENNRLVSQFAGVAPVAPANLRTSGTGIYEGTVGIRIDSSTGPGVPGTNLVGDAEVTANFATDTVRGTYDNFVGRFNGQSPAFWNNALTSNATINAAAPGGQVIQGTIAGTLNSTVGGHTVTVSGPFSGNFLGASSPAFYPQGVQMNNTAATNIRLDGLNYGANTGSGCNTCVYVIGERN